MTRGQVKLARVLHLSCLIVLSAVQLSACRVYPVSSPNAAILKAADDAYDKGDYESASDLYKKLLHGTDATPKDRADAMNGLGRVRRNQGHFGEARALYEQVGDLRGVANADMNVGILYGNRGDYDGAVSQYVLALERFRQIDNVQGQARALGNLMTAETELKRFLEAETHGRDALTLYKRAGYQKEEADAYLNLGRLFFRQDKTRLALEYMELALNRYHALGHRPYETIALENLGFFYDRQGNTTLALAYYLEAYELAQTIQDTRAALRLAGNIKRLEGNNS